MIRPLFFIQAMAMVLSVGLLPGLTHAQPGNEWALCGSGHAPPTRPARENRDAGEDEVEITADDADIQPDGVSTLRGNVLAHKGAQTLNAGKVTYSRDSSIVDASGDVRFWGKNSFLKGDKAQLDLNRDKGWIDNVNYLLLDRHGNGSADRIDIIDGGDLMKMSESSYTTCDPGAEDWWLTTSSLKLDNVEDVGTARNVTVRFKGMPIFYSPWMTFPTSKKRKSGFLTPGYGGSAEVGYEVTVPYYWNIAPDRDATLGVRAMTKRGVMLQGEYRYLMENGHGKLAVEYMPHDIEHGGDRGLYTVRHDQYITPNLRAIVNIDHVQDKDYFEELGNQLGVTSTRYLDRRGDIYYNRGMWSLWGRVQAYQTVDRTIPSASRPYEQLPKLVLNVGKPERSNQFNPHLRSEYVRFRRTDRVESDRVDLYPTVTYPYRTAAGFITPKLGLRYTYYDLSDRGPILEKSEDRVLPLFSLDGGLYVDKFFRVGGMRFTHTLEPRLYFLYIPYKDQDDIPNFDTGEYTFSYSSLFREDRFSSIDRRTDANQLTTALTTRLLDEDNVERLRLGIGQIHYFRDRKVTLPGAAEKTRRSSDLIAEARAQITQDFSAWGMYQWDTYDDETNKSSLSLRYQPDTRRVINLGMRYLRNELTPADDQVKQLDFSTHWPFSPRFSVVARYYYDLPNKRIMDSVAGIEYQNCCWGVRAVVRRFLNTSEEAEHVTALFLQLELKGLAGVGQQTEALLRQQIPGYENDF